MRSPGIGLDELLPVFEQELFVLDAMDILYPEPPAVTDMTLAELARQAGMDPGLVSQVMVAAGFPAPDVDDPMRSDDVQLVRLLLGAGQGLGNEGALFRLARVVGEPGRRMAESGLALFDEYVLSRVMGTRPDRATRVEFNAMAAALIDNSETLIGKLYRRHLEHALLRLWANAAESYLEQIGVRSAEHDLPGIAFVDLSGFTALTESAGDATAARLAATLAELAEHAAVRRRGRVVKLLGDGAMLFFEHPLDAVRGALDLVASISGSNLPAAHAGVHQGSVIARDGDFFGRTVNFAARIAAHADPGQVLVSASLAELSAPDLKFHPAGERAAKGIGDLAVYVAERNGQESS